MKKCLKYMSSLVGSDMYMIIVIGFILFPIMVDNIFLIMVFTWCVNALSLSIFGNGGNVLYKMDGRDKLTLSLPLSRETIYDTRMYFVGALYLAGILLSSIACIPYDIYVYYFCVVMLLLLGHIMCALCIRKPYLQIISGVPAFIVLIKRLMYDRQDFWSFVVDEIEPVMMLRVYMGIICIVIIVIDIFIWRYERRIFINGSLKGNVTNKNNGKEADDYNLKKLVRIAKLKRAVLIAVLAIVLILPLLLIFGGVFLDREMEYNRHGVTRYLVTQKTDSGWRDIGEYDGLDVRLYDIDSASFYTEDHETIGLEKALNSNLISIEDMCKYPFEYKQIMYKDQTAEDYIFETYQIIVTDTECIICPLNDIPEH